MVNKKMSQKNKNEKCPYEISEIDEKEIPQEKKRTGIYAQIEEKLKKLPEGKALKVIVPKKTIAGGLWNYFKKKKGYIVIQRTVENGVMVIIQRPKTK